MSVRSKWLYILLGNDRTGKTKLQKNLVKLLSDQDRDYRLDCNLVFPITNHLFTRKIRDFSIGNRSYQEKLRDYQSVENYFETHFRDADISFISSHVTDRPGICQADIDRMILEGRRQFFNVCGVFFENSISQNPSENRTIAALNWDERLLLTNPLVEEEEEQNTQLQQAAVELVRVLSERTRLW